jgi:GAF domain-containing protein
MAKPLRILMLLTAATALVLPPVPARAGLLRPVLLLLRPQLENQLTRVCVETASAGRVDLVTSLQDPCRKLAAPTSRCLIEETDRTGRGLGVLTEMVGGRFGDDSEVVVKRCLARLLGLPVDSLRDVPLRDLARRFGTLGTLGCRELEARAERSEFSVPGFQFSVGKN